MSATIMQYTRPEEVQNPELADTIRRLRRISDGGYDLLEKNHATIVRLLKKHCSLQSRRRNGMCIFRRFII